MSVRQRGPIGARLTQGTAGFVLVGADVIPENTEVEGREAGKEGGENGGSCGGGRGEGEKNTNTLSQHFSRTSYFFFPLAPFHPILSEFNHKSAAAPRNLEPLAQQRRHAEPRQGFFPFVLFFF